MGPLECICVPGLMMRWTHMVRPRQTPAEVMSLAGQRGIHYLRSLKTGGTGEGAAGLLVVADRVGR